MLQCNMGQKSTKTKTKNLLNFVVSYAAMMNRIDIEGAVCLLSVHD